MLGFLRRLDWILLLAVGAIVAYGLWAMAGITRFDVEGDENYYVVRQAIAVGLGFAGFLLALAIDPDRYRRAQKWIYGLTLVGMLLVFPLADATRGSKRWIEIGPFQFQPSEFGKLLFVLALAGFLADRIRRVHEPRVVLQAIGLAAIPIALVFKQPDLGTALVYGAALVACLFVAGIRWSHLALLSASSRCSRRASSGSCRPSASRCSSPTRRRGSTSPTSRRIRAVPPTTRRSRSRPSARAASTGAASRVRRRRGSTTCPSTTPTSSSRRSPSSAASSALRSCSASTC